MYLQVNEPNRLTIPAGTGQRQKFPLVQALRALAALAVVFTHTAYNGLSMAPGAPGLHWLYHAAPWWAGVDVFFVISGFVIVWSSQTLFGRNGAASIFLTRRLARIVPLYWVMTTLYLVSAWLLPHAVYGNIGGVEYILKSYLFIPASRPDGLVQPVLGLGWTLNFEMFFYLIFAQFLGLSRTVAILSVGMLFGCFVILGQTGDLPGTMLDTWSQPIVLEFCAGMFLAFLPGRISFPLAVRAAVVVLALVLLVEAPPWPRIFGLGLPALALVAAAVTGPKDGQLPSLEVWLVRLGDASYALYLVHPFVMRAVALVWKHLHQSGSVEVYVALCLVVSQVIALLLHRIFERPVTAYVRRWLETAQQTVRHRNAVDGL